MPSHDHELAVISDSGRTDYRFEAVGFVEPLGLNDHDEVDEKAVVGHVNGGTDVIAFDGAPKGLAFPGDVGDYRLELDGEPIDPFHLNMRTMRVETTADKAPYRFAVDADGRIIGSGTTNETEVIGPSGTSARGRVRDGEDTWHFAGALVAVDSNQNLTVTIDNRELDVAGNPPVGAI